MLQRLRRSAIGFAAVLAAFTVYRVAAVPFLEPAVPTPKRAAGDPLITSQPAVDPVLARLFPPGSPFLDDPIKLENDHSELLMREYHNLPDGRVEMVPCAIVFFPGDARAANSEQTQGRIIVLEALEGATAQFDQPLDLQGGKIGRLLGAKFHGPVKIRGTPSKPGGADDIDATTQDVQMNTELIWTPEPVDFRFGQNFGHGRDLQIRLLPSNHAGDHGPSVGGIRTIELMHDVRMRLVSTSGGMMPMDAKHPTAKPVANTTDKPTEQQPPAMPTPRFGRTGLPAPVPDMASIERQQSGERGPVNPSFSPPVAPPPQKTSAEENPPVDIRCKGKFHFDMVQYLATFDDQVDVLRTPRDGPSDRNDVRAIDRAFAPREMAAKPSGNAAVQNPGSGGAATKPAPAAAPSPDPSSSSNQKMPNLEPRRLEARGNPVIVRAPSNGSYARGEHLDYDIRSGEIILDGDDEVTMQQQLNEIHARSIDYQPGELGRLGRLLAIGPGWLRGVPPQHQPEASARERPLSAAAPQQPPQLFEAHWSRQLKMRPYEQNHVISLLGNARAGFTGQGELSADEIHLWLLEPPPADKSHPAPTGSPKSQIQPDRMLAIGQVQINSPQLLGSCSRLEAWFQQATEPQSQPGANEGNRPLSPTAGPFGVNSPAGNGGGEIGSGATAANRSPVGNSSPPMSVNAPPLATPQNGFIPPFGAAAHRTPNATPSRYEVDGQRIRVQLLMHRDGPTTLDDLAVDGQVHLVEVQTPTPGDEPLRISGESLQVVHASEPNTDVTISGRPAQAASRGMEMYGDVIRLDKGVNRLWIDGPGRMKLPANQVMSDDGGGLGGRAGYAPNVAPHPAGAPQPSPQPIYVDWQGRMAFDGLLARFERSVVCQTDTRNLRTELLDVTMRQRVNFSQPQAGQRTDLGRIFCHGDVLMESRGFDPQHVLTNVERLRARNLTVDEVSGLIDGQGPGWLTSVRRGAQDLTPGSLGTPNGRPGSRASGHRAGDPADIAIRRNQPRHSRRRKPPRKRRHKTHPAPPASNGPRQIRTS